jgi:hypothetical protein
MILREGRKPRAYGASSERRKRMSAIPAPHVTEQPLPLAVTLTTDEANAAASALEVLDLYYQTLSPRAASALKSLKQQLGGGR